MLYWLARGLQLLGLLIVPIAVAGNLAEVANVPFRLDIKQMLLLSALGIVIFYLGHTLERKVAAR